MRTPEKCTQNTCSKNESWLYLSLSTEYILYRKTKTKNKMNQYNVQLNVLGCCKATDYVESMRNKAEHETQDSPQHVVFSVYVQTTLRSCDRVLVACPTSPRTDWGQFDQVWSVLCTVWLSCWNEDSIDGQTFVSWMINYCLPGKWPPRPVLRPSINSGAEHCILILPCMFLQLPTSGMLVLVIRSLMCEFCFEGHHQRRMTSLALESHNKLRLPWPSLLTASTIKWRAGRVITTLTDRTRDRCSTGSNPASDSNRL